MSQDSQVVAEFERGKRGFVRASVSQFRGKKRIDLRLWIEPRDSPGAALLPTKLGLNLPAEYAQELAEAAQALLAAVGQTG